MNKKTKIVVIGASGVLGGLICREIDNLFGSNIELFIGDYNITRGKAAAEKLNVDFCETGTDDTSKLLASLSDKDIVIVAINQREPVIQKICLDNSILCIDITVNYTFANKVQDLYDSNRGTVSTSLLMAGFFPGLSGLLIQKAIKDFDEINEANITLLQNTNAKTGATGIIDMLKIVSEPVRIDFNDKVKILSGFNLKRKINIPQSDEIYKVRLISHSEKQILQDKLQIGNLNYWTAWNSPIYNSLVSMLKKTGIVNFVINRIKKETLKKAVKFDKKKSEETFLIADIKGFKGKIGQHKKIAIKAFSDYGTTAKVAAALTKIVLQKKSKGICFPFEITSLDEILEIINDERVKYIEN